MSLTLRIASTEWWGNAPSRSLRDMEAQARLAILSRRPTGVA
jgi:hypothetical protein